MGINIEPSTFKMVRNSQDVEEITVDTSYCTEESAILHPSHNSRPKHHDDSDNEVRGNYIRHNPQLWTSPKVRNKLVRSGPAMDLLRAVVLLFTLTIIGGILMGLYYHRKMSRLNSEYEQVVRDFRELNQSTYLSSRFRNSNQSDLSNKLNLLVDSAQNKAELENLVASGCSNVSLIITLHLENSWLKAFIKRTIPKENLTNNLLLAINAKDIPAICRLVELGADIDGFNNLSQTPLHLAAASSNKAFSLNAIKILIENKADPYAKDKEGYTFLHKLVQDGTTLTPQQFRGIVELLISKNISQLFNSFSKGLLLVNPFQLAVKNIEIQTGTLDILKRSGVDFGQVDGHGNSLLFYSVEGRRSPAFLSDMIALGTDPNHLNIRKRGVLHWTAEYGNVEQLKFFLNLGSLEDKINVVDVYGNTPLLTLIEHNNTNILEMTRLLIQKGADERIENFVGKSPLSMAVESTYLVDKDKVVKLLSQ